MSDNRTECATCVFFGVTAARASWADPHQPAGHSQFGICRRYPPLPVVIPGGTRSVWPPVSRNEWCGEHTVLGQSGMM